MPSQDDVDAVTAANPDQTRVVESKRGMPCLLRRAIG